MFIQYDHVVFYIYITILYITELTKSNYQFGKSYGENDFIFEEQDVGVLTHLTISRRHFQIELRDVGDRKLPYITDLSSNGTFVQGSLIGRNNCRILSHGDIISLSKKNQKCKYLVVKFKIALKEKIVSWKT